MFIEYIERLRTRPIGERRRFALLFAGCITAIIAVLWGLTLPARLASLELNIDELTEASDTTTQPSETQTDTAGALQGLINIKKTLKGNAPAPEGVDGAAVYTDTETYAQPQARSVILATSTREAR